MVFSRFPASSPTDGAKQRLRRWDLRLMIAIPALMVLIVIAVGLTNYLLIMAVSGSGVPTGNLERVLGELQGKTLAALLVFVALALVAGLALAWSILKPVHRLAAAVADIASGDLKEPLKIRGGFEIDRLGESFNSVIQVLRATMDERDAFLNEGLAVGSLILNSNGVVLSANRRALEILQAEREEIAGLTLEDGLGKLPSAPPALVAFLRSQLAEIDASPRMEGRPEKRIDGDKPLAVAAAPLFTPQGDLASVVFHFRDLSRIRDLNLLFSRMDQMAALGTFTMGLSHELRNPMAAIKGSAQLMGEKTGENSPYAPHIGHIVREVDRLDKLVRELYDFSRSPGGPRSACDLNELAASALEWALQGTDAEAKRGRHISASYGTNLPRPMIQKDRMMQAVGNVIVNALEHTPEGATMSVRTFTPADSPSCAALEIANTGSRIAPEDLERVFEPFYSTKAGGMGLGLAIAYQIAAQSRCQLQAFSDSDTVRFQFLFRPRNPGK